MMIGKKSVFASKDPAFENSYNTSVNKPRKLTKEELKKQRLESAKKFSEDVVKKYNQIIKAIVVFGSVARKEQTFTSKSDIDCVVIIDDTAVRLSGEQREKLDYEIQNMARDADKRISIQPVWLLTEFWQMIREQSPLAYSVLREGFALYDTGFFIPLCKLYDMGKFPATKEAAYIKLENVPKRIKRAETAKAYIVFEDLFYAMLEASQAVLMFIGKEPPGVRASPSAVKKHLVEEGLLEDKWADMLENVVKFHKAVEHGEIKTITGAELDEWIEKAKKYTERFEVLLKRLEDEKKAEEIKKMSEVMLNVSRMALKSINKLPDNSEKIAPAIKTHLIETGLVSPNYDGLLEKVLKLKEKVEGNKVSEITDKDVYSNREYVRRFIFDVRKVLSGKQFVPRMKNRGEENKQIKN